MKQVLVRSGAIVVEEVPAPTPGPREVLLRVAYSCVSAGTELAGLRTSALPLYRRALKQPEHVRRALEMIREQGLARTWERISGKLAAGSPTGYSVAGEVLEVGSEVDGIEPGERLACAGAGIANHAEFVSVPVNLAAPVPAGVELADASTVTLGAIALQGVRRCAPTLGERIVVLGLGLLGQLTAQLLRANGCRVIGVDVNPERTRIASGLGLAVALDPAAGDWVAQALRCTEGIGADAVIVTASSSSPEVIAQALRCCRRKARVVVVGDVNLQLERADLYAKELDLLISTSYGPGRYDPAYEEGGQDYPLPYVRWTENRNMRAYLELLGSGALSLGPLRAGTFPVDRAAEAYEALKGGQGMIALLQYPQREGARARTVALAPRAGSTTAGALPVALVGAGGFAQGMHLPNLMKLRRHFVLQAVVSRTGANAKAVAKQYGAAYATTSLAEALADERIRLVMIATRHDQHAAMALAALEAGKHVFLEKPLALTAEELGAIERFYAAHRAEPPLLMTGFNRRFAPAVTRLRAVLRERASPLVVNYRMNAGYLPANHWVHGPEGGGRNRGEACHIYDLFQALTGSSWVHCQAQSIGSPAGQYRQDDNFVMSARYADGSLCTLTYTALGAKDYPKERMDVFCDGAVFALDDYRTLTSYGRATPHWSAASANKGQFEELEALAAALSSGGAWPISLTDQLAATRLALAVQAQLGGASAAAGT